MFVGLITSLASVSVPNGTNLIRSSGFNTAGRGEADYVRVASTVTADDLTVFADSNGNKFRLAETRRTPQMFGAVGDGTTDDTEALQAFFNDAIDAGNASRNVYDFSGSFAVSGPIYATYPSDDKVRRFQAGRIIVLQPAAPIQDVLTITGTLQVWEGELSIVDGVNGAMNYVYRRFYNGVRLMEVAHSRFEAIRVDGALRDAVVFDSEPVKDGWSVGTGPNQRSGTSKNNIGTQVGMIYARGCGSCHGSINMGYSRDVTARNDGGFDSQGAFIEGLDGYRNGVSQLTKLNVGDTSELAVNDIGRMRLEIARADSNGYDTLSFDINGRIVWSDGDPLLAKLAVGDRIILDNSGGVVNKYNLVDYEIVGFSGPFNREISVWPKPLIAQTNVAVVRLFTQSSYHAIMKIESSSEILVYPWVPTRSNSKWYSMHGHVANIFGGDTANIKIGFCGGMNLGGTLRSAGLYGAKVETLMSDFAEIGVLQGEPPLDQSLGTVVDHIHTEATEVNILQTSINAAGLDVKGASNLYLERIHTLNPRGDPTHVIQPGDFLRRAHIGFKGEPLDWSFHGEHSGNNYFAAGHDLTNAPSQSRGQVTGAGVTVSVDYDFEMGRLAGYNRAELFWVGTGGGAPTGTLSFQLSPALAFKGWTIAGTSSVTSPTKACLFDVRFYAEGKKVFINRFDAA